MMDGAEAWSDIIATYQQYDRPAGKSFMASVQNTLHANEFADCGALGPGTSCDTTFTCGAMPNSGHGDAGAAAYEIWNSFVVIRNVSTTGNKIIHPNQAEQMHDQFNTALFDTAAAELDPSLQDFENTFAPVAPKPDETWLNVLLDLVSMGAVMVFAPFFDACKCPLSFFDRD